MSRPGCLIIDVTGGDQWTGSPSESALVRLIHSQIALPGGATSSRLLRQGGMEGPTFSDVTAAISSLVAQAEANRWPLSHLRTAILFQEYGECTPISPNVVLALAVFRLTGREPEIIGVQQTENPPDRWRIVWIRSPDK